MNRLIRCTMKVGIVAAGVVWPISSGLAQQFSTDLEEELAPAAVTCTDVGLAAGSWIVPNEFSRPTYSNYDGSVAYGVMRTGYCDAERVSRARMKITVPSTFGGSPTLSFSAWAPICHSGDYVSQKLGDSLCKVSVDRTTTANLSAQVSAQNQLISSLQSDLAALRAVASRHQQEAVSNGQVLRSRNR